MFSFEVIGSTNFIQDTQKNEKNYSNIYTLASNLYYSKEENNGPAQLGNTLISLF